jgi:hypothetical protein
MIRFRMLGYCLRSLDADFLCLMVLPINSDGTVLFAADPHRPGGSVFPTTNRVRFEIVSQDGH